MQQTKVTAVGALIALALLPGESHAEELCREGFEQGSQGEFHLFKAVGGTVRVHETAPSDKVRAGGARSFLIDCTLKLDAGKHKRGEVYAHFYLPMAPSDPRGIFCEGRTFCQVGDAPPARPMDLVYSYVDDTERGIHGIATKEGWPEPRISFGCAVLDRLRRYMVGHYGVRQQSDGWHRWASTATLMNWHYPDGRFVGPMVAVAAHLTEERPEMRIKVFVDDVLVTREPIYDQPVLSTIKEKKHPYLVATKEQFDRARMRAEKYEWARTLRDGFVKRADLWAAKKIEVPREFGGYGTAYYCEDKKCHGRLLPNKDAPTEMKCTKCGRRYTGKKWERVVAVIRHTELSKASYDLGMAYQLTGDKTYGVKCKEILLAYAHRYPSYPLRLHEGRLSWNWLGDCYLVETMIKGYDLCHDLFTPEERRAVETGLFLPTAHLIYHFPGVTYVSGTVRMMAATGLIGLALKDEELIYLQLLSPHTGAPGLYEYAFTDDGLSLLGGAYHYVALRELTSLGIAAQNAGMDFFGPKFKALLDGLIGLRFPDDSFPAFGHSGGGSLKGMPYSEGHAFYGDRRYLPYVMEHDLRHLLYIDEEEIPYAAELPVGSTDFPTTGYTLLRTGARDKQACLALNWGPPQRNDYAKLAIHFYARGAHLARPSGTAGYAHPLYAKWFAQSLQSNTLLVDGHRQKQGNGYQTFLQTEGPAQIVSAYTDEAYAGVRLERTAILLDSGIAVLVDRCASEDKHVYDWALHCEGELTTPLGMQKATTPPSGGPPYQAIEEVKNCQTSRQWQATFHQNERTRPLPQPEVWMHLTMLGGEPTTVYRALGFGHGAYTKVPMLIARRQEVKETVFISIMEPYREDPLMTGVKRTPVARGKKMLSPNDAAAFEITTRAQGAAKTKTYLVMVSFTEGPIQASGRTTDQRCQVFVTE